MVKQEFNSELFSKNLKTRRIINLNLELREVSKKIGISASTLSRLENGGVPDINTFATVCYWMGGNMYDYFIPKKQPKAKKNA